MILRKTKLKIPKENIKLRFFMRTENGFFEFENDFSLETKNDFGS